MAFSVASFASPYECITPKTALLRLKFGVMPRNAVHYNMGYMDSERKQYIVSETQKRKERGGKEMILIIVLFVLIIIFLLVAARMMNVREMEQENELMQSYMMSMEEFYAGLQNKIEATRKYRHDLARHIQTLETLLLKYDQPEGIQEYMDNLKERYQSLKQQEFGSDEIVNSILVIKKEQCAEKQIPVRITVEDGIYNGIEEVDLVSLLHNLLDNAIKVTFLTRKPVREEHGIGTKIIANIVEKYHGSRTFASHEEEGMFEDRIELVME